MTFLKSPCSHDIGFIFFHCPTNLVMKNLTMPRLKSINVSIRITDFLNNIRRYSTAKVVQAVNTDKIRNIGILAHIDAGKTTTTERMLYYAGSIQQMGEVHHGNTVTDHLDQERERGITITSAAITLYWKKHQFNLIDTPGHIDFTMEVEKTLSVLDGAIVVLDGSAGVEAQTLTVWRQANKNKIPRIIYVNKMDRTHSDILMCSESIENKLETTSLLLQLPVFENSKLVGIIDILTMEFLNYGLTKEKLVNRIPLTEDKYSKYWKDAKQARSELINKLTDFDDELANIVISSESVDDIATPDIIKSIELLTRKQAAVPILLGSSYKNIGVQPLMDAVILYLPSPNKTHQQFSAFEESLCARAFKVIHNKQKGPLVFFRLYNGALKKGQKLYSMKQDTSEQIGKLYIANADDFKEVEEVNNGNIAVVSGLKTIISGDFVTNSSSSSQKAKKNIKKRMNDVGLHETDAETLLGLNVTIPEPVFFCSIEPSSLSVQSALDQALSELQREDPSLRVTYESETGQTVLAGMGELHLEIIRDRILRDYKIEVDLGPLQISYREVPVKKSTDTSIVETRIGNSKQLITVKLSIVPSFEMEHSGDILKLDKSPEYASNIANIFPKHLVAIRQGVEVGMAHGPKINCQVINTQVVLHYIEIGRGTSETMITATVTQLVSKMLKQAGTDILEPVMNLEILTPDDYLSSILADLSRRRSTIRDIGMKKNAKVVLTQTPLSELLGYSTVLRTLSSGTATFSMEFSSYEKMSPDLEIIAIRNVRGF